MIALMHGPFSIRLTSGSSRLEAKRSIVPLTQQHQSSLYFIFFYNSQPVPIKADC